jgi:hypothetical protein
VHQAVLLRDSARPATRKHIFQRLRLSYASKRIAQNSLDEFEGSKRNLPVHFETMAWLVTPATFHPALLFREAK